MVRRCFASRVNRSEPLDLAALVTRASRSSPATACIATLLPAPDSPTTTNQAAITLTTIPRRIQFPYACRGPDSFGRGYSDFGGIVAEVCVADGATVRPAYLWHTKDNDWIPAKSHLRDVFDDVARDPFVDPVTRARWPT